MPIFTHILLHLRLCIASRFWHYPLFLVQIFDLLVQVFLLNIHWFRPPSFNPNVRCGFSFFYVRWFFPSFSAQIWSIFLLYHTLWRFEIHLTSAFNNTLLIPRISNFSSIRCKIFVQHNLPTCRARRWWLGRILGMGYIVVIWVSSDRIRVLMVLGWDCERDLLVSCMFLVLCFCNRLINILLSFFDI